MIVRANRADGSIQSSNGVNVDELRALVLRQLPEERAEAVLTRFDNDRRGLLETVSKRAPSIAIARRKSGRFIRFKPGTQDWLYPIRARVRARIRT
jgi:hypothetical protein